MQNQNIVNFKEDKYSSVVIIDKHYYIQKQEDDWRKN